MARYRRRTNRRRGSSGRARGFRRRSTTRFKSGRKRAKRTFVTVSRGGIRL